MKHVTFEWVNHLGDMIAGFSGSVVALFTSRNIGRYEALAIVISGVLAAWAGTSYVAGFLPPGDGVRGVAGFILGFSALAVAGRVAAVIRTGKLPIIGRQGRDDGQ